MTSPEEAGVEALGQGIALREKLSVQWHYLPQPPEAEDLANLDAANQQCLSNLALLEDHPLDLHDKENELAQEFVRLESKVSLLLSLLGQYLTRQQPLAEPVPVELSAQGVAWQAKDKIAEGQWLKISLYLRPDLPLPLTFIARTLSAAERAPEHASEKLIRAVLKGITDETRQSLEKLIFRKHRRSIAQQKALQADVSARVLE